MPISEQAKLTLTFGETAGSNKGIHRSARSEFLIVPSVPLARPVMPGVMPPIALNNDSD
jgi:hypothetical protein